MKNKTAIYHWWSYPNEPSPAKNIRTPIVMSIASLRAVSDINIVVLDVSEKDNNWEDLPEMFDFKVYKIKSHLEQYRNRIEGWPYLSRIYDINNWSKNESSIDTIMYVDSDVFFLRNPEPFDTSPEKFVFDGWNSGFFYYKFKNNNFEQFFDIFNSYTKSAIYSQDIRNIMKKYVGYDAWYGVWDEMILTYMSREHPELFNITGVNEHATSRVIQYVDKDKIKMFHCNGTMVENPINSDKHCRGLFALLAKEIYLNISKKINETDMCRFFDKQTLSFCLSRQFSLFEDMKKLLSTKDEYGHYHIKSMLSEPIL